MRFHKAIQPFIPLLNYYFYITFLLYNVHITGKLVTIKGTVIRVGSVGLICTSMAFECSSCHNIQAIVQPQGVFTGICLSSYFTYLKNKKASGSECLLQME